MSSTHRLPILSFLIVSWALLSSASTASQHHAIARSPQLLEYGSTTGATTASPLHAIDITLDAPIGPTTCGAAQVVWNWDRVGLWPNQPVDLSVVNVTSLAWNRRRRSANRHTDANDVSYVVKRAPSLSIQDASNIPFTQGSFQWDPITLSPGQYRIRMTVVANDESVVSDPFFVLDGSDDSCLDIMPTASAPSPQPPSATSGSSEPSLPSQTANITSGAGNDGASSTTGSNPTAGPSAGSSEVSTPSNQSGQSHHNTGGIVAGILVPLFLILAGLIAFFWRRKRQSFSSLSGKSNGAGEERWYHRFFGSSAGSGASSPRLRDISAPEMASAAGLASVARLVPAALRSEKDEIALQWSAVEDDFPHSRRGAGDDSDGSHGPSQEREHWVDFSADDAHNINGPRPLSPSTIDSPAFSATGSNTVGDGGNRQLYSQGQNVPLSQWSRGSSLIRHSQSSNALSLSGASIATFSTLSNPFIGRDLIASVPLARPRTQSDAENPALPTGPHHPESSISPSPFDDDNGTPGSGESTDSTAHQRSESQATAKLTRSDSNSSHGIKRKPVPRFSGANQNGTKVKDEAVAPSDPFSNVNAIGSSSLEILRPSGEISSPPTTPPRPPTKFHAATPASIPETAMAMSDTMSIHRRTLDLPTNVSTDDLAVTSHRDTERAAQNLYHLSINLGSEAGFRMSFDREAE